MNNKITAPFTLDQVAGLNAWQSCGHVHPFTCGKDSRHGNLIATPVGWICPDCDYKQDWAHDFMASGAPPNPLAEVKQIPPGELAKHFQHVFVAEYEGEGQHYLIIALDRDGFERLYRGGILKLNHEKAPCLPKEYSILLTSFTSERELLERLVAKGFMAKMPIVKPTNQKN